MTLPLRARATRPSIMLFSIVTMVLPVDCTPTSPTMWLFLMCNTQLPSESTAMSSTFSNTSLRSMELSPLQDTGRVRRSRRLSSITAPRPDESEDGALDPLAPLLDDRRSDSRRRDSPWTATPPPPTFTCPSGVVTERPSPDRLTDT